MAIGSPVTNQYQIGTAELRIGPLTKAGMLTPAHSVGLVDQVTITVGQESVNLMGGFPQKLMDTAIISQSMTITATMREFSRRNICTMLGEGVSDTVITPVATTLAVAAPITPTAPVGKNGAGQTLTVATGTGAGFKPGNLIVIHPANVPENLSICRVISVAEDVITLDPNLPLLFSYEVGANVYTHEPVSIGNITKTNYMAVQVLQKDNNSGSPKIFQSWKASVASGMEYATSTTDFGSTELTLNCLEPSASEFAPGGQLAHLANVIPMYPTGMFMPSA